MRIATWWYPAVTLVTASVVLASASACQLPQSASSSGIELDDDDIGGVVTSENGPEGGVWVIAETSDFETRFARIVVTDDEGRYLVPDLPEAAYRVWVRGYGLVDSDKTDA